MPKLLPIHKIVYHELFKADHFERVPEKMVMEDVEQVEAYDSGSLNATGPLAVMYRSLAEHACYRISPGDKVLDIGCATGQLTYLYSCLNPESEFTGVDLSENMIKKAQNLKNPNLNFTIADATDLNNFPDASFDVVVSTNFFHQLPEINLYHDVLKSAFRVLKPNGKFFFADLLRPLSRKSVDLYAAPYADVYSPILLQDYISSLLAGFSTKELLAPLSDKKDELVIRTTAICRFFILFGSRPMHKLSLHQKKVLSEYENKFNRMQKWDSLMLNLFLVQANYRDLCKNQRA